MLEQVITGGQTGVDQAAWRSARKWGYQTAGMMPKDFWTERGPCPEFATLYNARESRSREYRVRTQANVQAANAVLWLGPTGSPGFHATIKACTHGRSSNLEHSLSRRCSVIADLAERLQDDWTLYPVRDLLMGICKICIAGSRESRHPGIGQLTEEFLDKVFAMIQEKQQWDYEQAQLKLVRRQEENSA